MGKFFLTQSTESQSGSHNKTLLVESKSEEHLISQETRDPLWQRLQNLEAVVTEMVNKPTTIPPEKEDILHESLNRIKSIEYDLQKTKKVVPVSYHIVDYLMDIFFKIFVLIESATSFLGTSCNCFKTS